MNTILRNLIPVIIIFCLGIVVYSNTFHCSFSFDDYPNIVNNSAIKSLQDLSSIWHFYPCRFVTFYSLALNYHFGQLNVQGYHLFNLIVHLISAILVWWLTILTLSTPFIKERLILKSIFRKEFGDGNGILAWLMNKGYLQKISDTEYRRSIEIMDKERDALQKQYPTISNRILNILQESTGNRINKEHIGLIALFAGLVFVSHPIQTEAVTYIYQRAASLAALFYLAALSFYAKSRLLENEERASITGRLYYVLSVTASIAAMLTKENAITLPFMILFYEICFLGNKKSINWRGFVPFFLTFFIIPLIMLLTKSNNIQEMGIVAGPHGISPTHYLMTQFRVMVTYLRLVFLPINQNFDYDYPISKSIFELPTLSSLLFLIIIVFGSQRLFFKYRLVAFFIFWFFLTLLPESSILPFHDLIFEHRLYLPLAGFSIFLASSMYYLWGKKAPRVMIIILMGLIFCNSILTYQRNKIWKDGLTLWGDVTQKSPHKSRAYDNIGFYYEGQGDLVKAVFYYNRAIEIDPKDTKAYYNRGIIYNKQHRFTESLSDYNKAIEISPYDAEAYLNRGTLYLQQGRLPQAIADYTEVIKLNPNFDGVYYNRGIAYDMQGDLIRALSDYNMAIEINPQYTEAYINLGIIHEKQGDSTQALLNYNKAIEINPFNAIAYYNRGEIYRKQNNFPHALSDYNKAIELDPNYQKAYIAREDIQKNHASKSFDSATVASSNEEIYNRALMFAKQGHFTQAMSDINGIITTNPNYMLAYIGRANIYSLQHKFKDALSDYSKAIELSPNSIPPYYDRAVTYYLLKEFDKAWFDVYKVRKLGGSINPKFLKLLQEASGKEDR